MSRFASIALPVPLRRAFTYAVPDGLVIEVGQRVAVPFGSRKVAGFVIDADAPAPPEKVRIRSIIGLLDAEPVFTGELMRLLVEAADYYIAPIGEVLRAASPALDKANVSALREAGELGEDDALGTEMPTRVELYVRRTYVDTDTPKLGEKQAQVFALLADGEEHSLSSLRAEVQTATQVVKTLEKRGLVSVEVREAPRDLFFREGVERDAPHVLNPAQAHAVAGLSAAIDARKYEGVLLHGVTSSGKTEVYLQAISHAREQGRGAILLVPEIALTPQLVSRFRARFGDAIAVLHSGLTANERHSAWRALRRGELTLAVGARSAIFAPVANLGIIAVDEEHDSSFKQEEGFRYQARDLALLRAARAGAVCVLGSATPSIEAYELARTGKLKLFEMPERATPRPLPKVEIVNLARNPGTPSGNRLLSAPLHRALAKCLDEKGQAILFLNRRGFAPSLRCNACGEIARCPACSVSLTEHRRARVLRCHYCDFTLPMTDHCPTCREKALEPIGLGTEKLEDELHHIFPTARVGRLDRDVATSAKRVDEILRSVRARELDILVGTQMVTKGHDLPGVTLVGVVLADQSLAFPDFRAAERTFQLIAQVAGRAGRGSEEGLVIVQTFQPEHPAIRAACAHDYATFFANERLDREVGYPPFERLVAIRLDGGDEDTTRATADKLVAHLAEHRAIASGRVRVLGPAPAPIARLRGRFRFRVLLRSPDRRALADVAKAAAARIEEGIAPVRASVDVDPVSML